MIIKIKKNHFELVMTNIFLLKKLKHTYTYKSLLQICIIYNYIIYRLVSIYLTF